MDASIIVCTYNRSGSLKRTLDCLSRLNTPEDLQWEVVIVDNNSIDDTRQLVESERKRLDFLRYEFESQQGLSHARNCGIGSAKGDILVFTDDDVCPEPDWLERIVSNMRESGCDACGGYIAPSWEKQPPSWLTERFYGFLAIKTDDGDPYRIDSRNNLPFGANMAFNKTVFEQVGLFDTSRGRKGNVLASGEDGEMFERILASGMKVMYFPDARVHHKIEAFRTEKTYFRRWRNQTSFNLAQSRGLTGERRLLGIPLYIFPQFLRAIRNAILARFTQPEDEAFNREMIVWHFIGTIRGLFLARKAIRNTDS